MLKSDHTPTHTERLVMNSKEEIGAEGKTLHQSSLEKLSFKQVDRSTHCTQVHSSKLEFTLHTGKQKRQGGRLCDMAANALYLYSTNLRTHNILTACDGEECKVKYNMQGWL